MDLRRLEVFCKVVELKSFSRAAEAVLLSQPTVSEHIRLLEEEIGDRLLDRLGREVLPTPVGEILCRHARRILHQRDEALQAIAAFRGKVAGQLVLGASTIPGAYLLPGHIESFKTSHPEVRILLKIAGSARIAREILDGQVELGIVGARSSETGLEWSELFADELLLAVHPGHPLAGRNDVALDELPHHPFLLREPDSGTRQVMTRLLNEHGLDLNRFSVVAEMGSNEAVREGVKARLGISFLSALAMRDDLRQGTLATAALAGLRLERPFFLARRRNRQLSPLAAAFLAELQQSRSL